MKNIEIIVVDDGSTDNSPRIIDRYARTDSRIVAIHKANEGLAYARKSGIEAAHGKYVQHLDGDDFLEPDACELLFNRAEETNADIVIMRFLIDSPCVQEEPPFWTQDEYNNISAIHTMAHEDYRWNLVFLFQRRDLHAVPIDYLQNLTYGEDAYQSIQIAYRSKNRNPQGQAPVPLCGSKKFRDTNGHDPTKGRKRLAIPQSHRNLSRRYARK